MFDLLPKVNWDFLFAEDEEDEEGRWGRDEIEYLYA